MLPVWLIFLLAIIEFGQVLCSQQQVELASRVGAEEASQTPDLPIDSNGNGQDDDIPANVLLAIDQQLASSGMTRCHVRLEHNVVPEYPNTPPVPVTLDVGTCDCEGSAEALPTMRRYVRVTVGIAMTELTPNLLSTFGFDISDRIVQHTTTFRYEL